MNKSLAEITRDLVLAKNDYEIFNEEQLMARVDELYTELHQKEDGIFWLYKESEKEISLFEEQIKKLKNHTNVMKRAQERLKSLVKGTYAEVGQLPRHSVFNPIKISESAGAVDVLEENDIPDEYFIEVITKKLDKKRILKELKEGTRIPGVRLVTNSYVRGLK
tara:strand:+ start:285 stop:776 length:492 start_codon:yes stop_codon:yes gene_type:complete